MSIYLDHNATTPPAPSVAHAVARSLREHWGNPSSVSGEEGTRAKAALEEARRAVGAAVGVDEYAAAEEITFTSGGTECNHWVIHSCVTSFESKSRLRPHVVTTEVEHPATELPLAKLEEEGRADVTRVAVDAATGRADADDVAAAMVPGRTCLVTVMSANNETGVLMPIKEMSQRVKEFNSANSGSSFPALFHTDAAQAVGKVAVDLKEWGVDFATIVGHKFYGPRNGALYHRKGVKLSPLFLGGGQERGLRAGTENVAMAEGLAEAAKLTTGAEAVAMQAQHQRNMRDRLMYKLQSLLPGPDGVRDNFATTPEEFRLPNTLSASFDHKSSSDVIRGHQILAECRGRIQASTQAACHTEHKHNQDKGSPVLRKSGVSRSAALSTLRLSVGRDTTAEEVDAAAEVIAEAVLVLRERREAKKKKLCKCN